MDIFQQMQQYLLHQHVRYCQQYINCISCIFTIVHVNLLKKKSKLSVVHGLVVAPPWHLACCPPHPP